MFFFSDTVNKIIHCTRVCTLSVQELFVACCSLLVTLASKRITVGKKKKKDEYIKKKYHSMQYLIYKFLFLLRRPCCWVPYMSLLWTRYLVQKQFGLVLNCQHHCQCPGQKRLHPSSGDEKTLYLEGCKLLGLLFAFQLW